MAVAMEYRQFGRSKVKVSVVGMGTYIDLLPSLAASFLNYQSGRQEKIAALKKGIELGINLIDTAEGYGTEANVAEAIKSYKRDELFIATKVGPTHLKYDQVLKAARRSLQRLQSSYIDLYQIHYPSPFGRVPIKETMRAMEKLVDGGKVKYIGVSNFSLAQTKEAEQALSRHELVSTQMRYSLKTRGIEADLLPYCEQNGIAILAYRPIAHGVLANPSGKLKAVMDEISKAHGRKTPAQIALNWILNKSKLVFPIPRASRPERAVENAGAVGWSLTPEESSRLEDCLRE